MFKSLILKINSISKKTLIEAFASLDFEVTIAANGEDVVELLTTAPVIQAIDLRIGPWVPSMAPW